MHPYRSHRRATFRSIYHRKWHPTRRNPSIIGINREKEREKTLLIGRPIYAEKTVNSTRKKHRQANSCDVTRTRPGYGERVRHLHIRRAAEYRRNKNSTATSIDQKRRENSKENQDTQTVFVKSCAGVLIHDANENVLKRRYRVTFFFCSRWSAIADVFEICNWNRRLVFISFKSYRRVDTRLVTAYVVIFVHRFIFCKVVINELLL